MSEITKELTIVDKVKVFERDGKQWTTSLNIAEVFGKPHKDVLDKIENLECSQEFSWRNFSPTSYTDKSSGKLGLSEKEINSLFDTYHTQLRIWQSKKPLQLQIGVANG
jgi:Rha family phage regulatory protein